jgi:hypothetical protein
LIVRWTKSWNRKRSRLDTWPMRTSWSARDSSGRAFPKIEVFRQAAHAAPLYDPADSGGQHYLAIVADTDLPQSTVPVIRSDDAAWLDTLADLVERRIMRAGELDLALETDGSTHPSSCVPPFGDPACPERCRPRWPNPEPAGGVGHACSTPRRPR